MSASCGEFRTFVQTVFVVEVSHYMDLLSEAEVALSVSFSVGGSLGENGPFYLGFRSQAIFPDVSGQSG